MSKRSRFVNVEAESSDEEYDSEEYSEDLDGFVDDESADDYDKIDKSQYSLKKDSYRNKIDELERRYISGNNYNDEEEEEDEQYTSKVRGLSQSSLLPTPDSPLLYLVRCKIGKEADVVNKIVERCNSLKNTTNNLNSMNNAVVNSTNPSQIMSAVAKDGLKGYIYVESRKKSAVEDILRGLKNVFRSRISIVPFREMVEAINYKKEYIVNEFGRIRGGKYKGDLIQVVENNPGDISVKVKVIPRLGSTNDSKIRPPAQLFNPEEFRTEVIRKEGGYYYNRDFYQDGFLIKMMLKSNIDFNSEYSFAELSRFSKEVEYVKDTKIKVVKGDLKNMVGTVEATSNNTLKIKNADGKVYDLDKNYIQKYYEIGEEVSIENNGSRINGIILKIQDESGTAVLGINDCEDEITTNLDALQKPVAEVRKVIERPRIKHIKRDPMVNKTIRIKRGEFKGQAGVVKDVYKGSYRVLLNSNKFINIDIADTFQGIDSIGSAANDGYKTPGYKTPAYKTPGYKTPGYKTPGYKTPGYKTPGGVTPYGFSTGYKMSGYQEGVTPGYDFGGSYMNTPGHKTPSGNNEKTPGYAQSRKYEEEAGTDWLNTSVYNGALITVNDKIYEIEDCAGSSYLCKTGDKFDQNMVKFVQPEQYEPVVIMQGNNKGTVGALVSIKGDIGSVRAGNGVFYNVSMSDISKKKK